MWLNEDVQRLMLKLESVTLKLDKIISLLEKMAIPVPIVLPKKRGRPKKNVYRAIDS